MDIYEYQTILLIILLIPRAFQRLRRIKQTSYSPLYSSALHNRFIHSIGVYYLGGIAFDSVKGSGQSSFIEESGSVKWDELEKLFTLACLLHDVGHSPFSHSGEDFYIDASLEDSKQPLYIKLIETVRNEKFTEDVTALHSKGIHAAPHEIMSAIIGISEFETCFSNDEDKAFFARCITGYQYSATNEFELDIKNILVLLLNSSIIDVDKLDYLIRDTYVIGFDSVKIDFLRLLSSIVIIYNDNHFQLAYHKSALSVIENVIYAHDSERKWIQNHPVVLYEQFLVQHSIMVANRKMATKESPSIFCYETLLKNGKKFSGDINISLLCDDDVVFITKNLESDDLTNEYYNRNKRRHPIWKSEAEYNTTIMDTYGEKSKALSKLESEVKKLEKFLIEELDVPIINNDALIHCKKIINKVKKSKRLEQRDRELQLQKYTNLLKIMKKLEVFCKKKKLSFNYVLICAKHFNSGFQKEELAKTIISFPNLKIHNTLGKVIPLLSAMPEAQISFFYLYQHRSNDFDIKELADELCKVALELK